MADLLRARVAGGSLFTIGGQFCKFAFGLVTTPILTRLLTPEDFGLIAMVTAMTGFATVFKDAGLSSATIQVRDISTRQLSNLFWFNLGVGLILGGLIALLSPGVAWIYGETRLRDITLILSLSFLFSGITVQHHALLRRHLQFVRLSILDVAASACSYGIGLLVAWHTRSYWALVCIPMCYALFLAVGVWVAQPWRPSWPSWHEKTGHFLSFGGFLAGYKCIYHLSKHADKFLIGWFLGAAAAGFYARVYTFLFLPIDQINTPLFIVALPVLSRLVDAPDAFRRFYLRLSSRIALVSAPIAAMYVVHAEAIVALIFGDQWMASAPILFWLGFVVLYHPPMGTIGWLFISLGKTRAMFWWGLIGMVIYVTSFLIALPWGPSAVALAYAVAEVLMRIPLSIYWASRISPISIRDHLGIVQQATGYFIVLCGGLVMMKGLVHHPSDLVHLVVGAVTTAAIWLSLVFLTRSGREFLVACLKAIWPNRRWWWHVPATALIKY